MTPVLNIVPRLLHIIKIFQNRIVRAFDHFWPSVVALFALARKRASTVLELWLEHHLIAWGIFSSRE